jgi:hypothetical protein
VKKKPPPRHLGPPAPVRVVSGSLIRIVLLACVALAGAIFALVLHYRVQRPTPSPPSAPDAGELPAPDLLPLDSSAASP